MTFESEEKRSRWPIYRVTFSSESLLHAIAELPTQRGNRLVVVLSRFAHHREHFALDLCRQFSNAVQISRFHQICWLYRRDGQCLPILIYRHTTGQNN